MTGGCVAETCRTWCRRWGDDNDRTVAVSLLLRVPSCVQARRRRRGNEGPIFVEGLNCTDSAQKFRRLFGRFDFEAEEQNRDEHRDDGDVHQQ